MCPAHVYEVGEADGDGTVHGAGEPVELRPVRGDQRQGRPPDAARGRLRARVHAHLTADGRLRSSTSSSSAPGSSASPSRASFSSAARGSRLAVLDKEPTLGAHQTGHSSGVVHRGVYYAPGSLKAQALRRGRRAALSRTATSGGSRSCAAARSSSRRRGRAPAPRGAPPPRRLANGVPGVELIGPERLRELEPHVAGVRALHSPETARRRLHAWLRGVRRRRRGRGRRAPARRGEVARFAPATA